MEEERDHTEEHSDRDEREEFYEMRRRLDRLRDRDYRTHNKSGCVMNLMLLPVFIVLLLISILSS